MTPIESRTLRCDSCNRHDLPRSEFPYPEKLKPNQREATCKACANLERDARYALNIANVRAARMAKVKAQQIPASKVKGPEKERKVRKPKTPLREQTFSKVKAELWRVFSLWIRQRAADPDGVVQCVTCGKLLHWRHSQAGHYITRARPATAFDETQVFTQCEICNLRDSTSGTPDVKGRPIAYRRFLVEQYGETRVQALEQRSSMPCHRTKEDMISMIEDYQRRLFEAGMELK